MTVEFNIDGSTKTAGSESFRAYVRAVWEEDGVIDLDDFDPDDVTQVKRWVLKWESEDE